jgi:hypothetical protein
VDRPSRSRRRSRFHKRMISRSFSTRIGIPMESDMRTKTEQKVESDVGIKREIRMADNTQKDRKGWVSGDDPMTGAQESYLKTLSEQAHKPDPAEDHKLTKAEASELIDKMRGKAGLEK